MIGKEQLETIKSGLPSEQQVKLELLFKAAWTCMQTYKSKFSKKNLDNWKAAEKALDEYVAEIRAGQDGPPEVEGFLTNINQIYEHLDENGWNTSRSGMYKHRDAGHIVPDDQGRFTYDVIEKFAAQYLRRLDGSRPDAESKDIVDKRKAETKKAIAQAKHWKTKADKEAGLLIEKSKFEQALAQRARVLKSDLDAWPPDQAGSIVELVDGNPEKIPDLIMYMRGQLAAFLNRYSQNPEL